VTLLAVGARALVVLGPGADAVVLADDRGQATGARLAADIEVEVLAWQPRGRAGARYRVRGPDGVEGWVDGAALRARPVEKAPPRVTRLPSAGTPPAGLLTARPRRGSR